MSGTMLIRPGDVAPKTGFYLCIYCRCLILCAQGNTLPPCTHGCRNPVYYFVHKEKTVNA